MNELTRAEQLVYASHNYQGLPLVLDSDERDYLVERLITFVALLEKPRETLAAPFVGTALPQVLASGSPREVVTDIVRRCLADAWNNDPPWLVLLIDLMPVSQTDAKLAEIRDRLGVRPAQAANRLAATILDNGTPFVDRSTLRSRLRRLATPDARIRPILVVTGAPKSGKSYSTEYIDHFSCRQPTATNTYRTELSPGTELQTGPEEVAIDLVASMGRPLEQKPRPNTNLKLLTQQLASWVLNQAVQLPAHAWLVLDNFQGDKLRADTRDLVVALADRVTNGIFRDRCRLILIGFDQSVLTVDPGKIDEERIAAFNQAEIAACVREVAARAPVPLDEQPLLSFVMDKLPNGDTRMKEMNSRLRALIMGVDQVAEAYCSLPGLDYASVLREVLTGLPAGRGALTELRSRLDSLRASAAEIAP